MRGCATVRRSSAAAPGLKKCIVDKCYKHAGTDHEHHADCRINEFFLRFGNTSGIPTRRKIQNTGIDEDRKKNGTGKSEKEIRKIYTGLNDVIKRAIAGINAVRKNKATDAPASAGACRPAARGGRWPRGTGSRFATLDIGSARTRIIDAIRGTL